jgi:hypothetical protein
MASVAAANSGALCSYTFSLKSFSGYENPDNFFKAFGFVCKAGK